MQVEIDDFRKMDRNTLRAFVRVRMPEGLVLHDVGIHARDGKAWASPPGRPVIGRDGSVQKDATGRAQYAPTLTFASRADQDAFSAAILAAVRAAHPEALP